MDLNTYPPAGCGDIIAGTILLVNHNLPELLYCTVPLGVPLPKQTRKLVFAFTILISEGGRTGASPLNNVYHHANDCSEQSISRSIVSLLTQPLFLCMLLTALLADETQRYMLDAILLFD